MGKTSYTSFLQPLSCPTRLSAMANAMQQLWAPISLTLEAVNYVSPEVALLSLDAFLASSGGTLGDQNTSASMLRLQAGLRDEINNSEAVAEGRAAKDDEDELPPRLAELAAAQDAKVGAVPDAAGSEKKLKKRKRDKTTVTQAADESVALLEGDQAASPSKTAERADESVAAVEGEPRKKKKRSKKHETAE